MLVSTPWRRLDGVIRATEMPELAVEVGGVHDVLTYGSPNFDVPTAVPTVQEIHLGPPGVGGGGAGGGGGGPMGGKGGSGAPIGGNGGSGGPIGGEMVMGERQKLKPTPLDVRFAAGAPPGGLPGGGGEGVPQSAFKRTTFVAAPTFNSPTDAVAAAADDADAAHTAAAAAYDDADVAAFAAADAAAADADVMTMPPPPPRPPTHITHGADGCAGRAWQIVAGHVINTHSEPSLLG